MENSTRKFKEKHPDYWKQYYRDHKKQILQTGKQWREDNKGDYIYFHISEDGEILYIGSSGGRPFIERQSLHMNGNSNIKLTINEYVGKYNFSDIIYKDFTNLNLSRQDLYFIEKYFKDRYKEIIDSRKVHYNKEKLTRSEEELIEIAESVEFKEFDIDRYLN